jgi:hypothetical protein
MTGRLAGKAELRFVSTDSVGGAISSAAAELFAFCCVLVVHELRMSASSKRLLKTQPYFRYFIKTSWTENFSRVSDSIVNY